MLVHQKPSPLFCSPPRAATNLISFRRQCLFSITRFATATAASPNPAPFAVKDYLVASCHLTPAQATKASKVLSHLQSPSKPEAVIAFLSGLGLSDADIATAVIYDPPLLCCGVEKTLTPRVAELRDLGLTLSQIARLVQIDPARFRRPTILSKLRYYVPLLGSFENLLQVLKYNSYLLSSDLERVVKPNVALLRECGLDVRDIAKLCLSLPRLLTTKPERIRAMVVCVEDIGVPCGSRMFRHALLAVAFLTEEKIAAKVEYLKETFRWSDDEVGVAVSKAPSMLRNTKERLCRMSEFLISEVGLEPEYIAHRPAMITYSLEGRLRPRYCVIKFLKANGLLKPDRSYYSAVSVSEKLFAERFIHPHKEAAPHLAEEYVAACRGKVPATFRWQKPRTVYEIV